MTKRRPVVTIAHAFGNNRKSLRRALASGVDMIEVDVWYRAGDLHVRHERRLGHFPLLYDGIMNGHPPGPFALRFGRHFFRPDVHSLRLSELMTTVAGQKRLLLDVKGRYDAYGVSGYVKTLVGTIR